MIEYRVINEHPANYPFVPTPPREGDAGWDIATPVAFGIAAGETVKIPLGFALQDPEVHWLMFGRSSLSADVIVQAPVIDQSYQGEWHVVLHNISGHDLWFTRGDRVAQVIPMMGLVHVSGMLEVDEFTQGSTRGDGGFGSTGA